MNRRSFLLNASTAVAGFGLLGVLGCSSSSDAGESHAGNSRPPASDPRWQLSESEWRQRLTPQQYRILRLAGTERPFEQPAQ